MSVAGTSYREFNSRLRAWFAALAQLAAVSVPGLFFASSAVSWRASTHGHDTIRIENAAEAEGSDRFQTYLRYHARAYRRPS
jgi:hypothetical protein